MSEFCAGVKILLERMKSNPEDFEMIDSNPLNNTYIRGRFYDFAQSIEEIILGKNNKDRPYRDWHYFTEEERQALIDGFKGMKRAKFDKGIMERVFDERYIERQREEMQMQYQPQQTRVGINNNIMAQQQAQNMAAQQALGMAGMGSQMGSQALGFDPNSLFK
jgi:hypothetical protein